MKRVFASMIMKTKTQTEKEIFLKKILPNSCIENSISHNESCF